MKQILFLFAFIIAFFPAKAQIDCGESYFQIPIYGGGNIFYQQLQAPALQRDFDRIYFDTSGQWKSLYGAPENQDDQFYFRWIGMLDNRSWIPIYYGCQDYLNESQFQQFRRVSVTVWRYNNDKKTVVTTAPIYYNVLPTKNAMVKKGL